MASLSRRTFLSAGVCGGAALLAGCLSDNTEEWKTDETMTVSTAVQYQSPNCDCCGVYAEYLDDHLETSVAVEEIDTLDAIKEEHGVHSDLRSCHTIKLDEYVVEGHIPVEVLFSLFAERPTFTGISLPGMPSGSPGMAGQKDDTWTIYGFDDSGHFEYTTL